MPPPEPHDEGHEHGGIDPLTAAQLEALTEAINNLSAKLGPSAVGGAAGVPGAAGSTALPWWFRQSPGRPGAPDAPPPGSAAAYDAGAPWWNRYTDPASGASPFIYVRSHWRAPRAPRPPQVMPSAARMTEATGGGQAGGGAADYPESVYQVAAATGESPDDIAAGLGIRRARRARAAGVGASPAAGGGGRGGKPPWWSAYAGMTPDQPEGGDPGRMPKGSPWWAKYYASAGQESPPEPIPFVTAASMPWNRKRGRRPFHWSTTRKFAAFARLRGGKRAGRMAMAGMSAAAQRFAFSGSISSAARVGIMGAAASGGPAVFGVVAMGVAAVKAAEALNKLTAEQMTYNRELGKSSAQMAFVFAQRDIQERMRNREVGDRLSASARSLVRAEQRFKDDTKEMDVFGERVKNYAGIAWEVWKTEFVQHMMPHVRPLIVVANKIAEHFESDEDRPLAFDQYVRAIAQEDAEARKRKDKKWEPPQLRH
jgi:hypothetical protein